MTSNHPINPNIVSDHDLNPKPLQPTLPRIGVVAIGDAGRCTLSKLAAKLPSRTGTVEDESGCVNVIVWKALKERQRNELLHAQLLAVHGTWQRDEDSGGQVCHLVAGFLRDLSPMLGELATTSRDFH